MDKEETNPSNPNGANGTTSDPLSHRSKGIRSFSEKHRQNIRLSRIGKKQPDSVKVKLSLAKKGLKMSQKIKDKISKANKGRKLSIEHRNNLRLSKLGEKGSNWKGGITPTNHLIRTSGKYKIWRETIFARDNYTCIWCGDNKGGNLQADHIISFSSIMEKLRFEQGNDDILNKAMGFELLWDINNGRTLCIKCHEKTDNFGGKRNGK